ncbi:hypothetical protein FQZ97_433040 [compost metagenome]
MPLVVKLGVVTPHPLNPVMSAALGAALRCQLGVNDGELTMSIMCLSFEVHRTQVQAGAGLKGRPRPACYVYFGTAE